MIHREIARRAFEKTAEPGAGTFEALWDSVADAAKVQGAGKALGELSDDEVERWWTSATRMANARAAAARAKKLAERAQAEMTVLYCEAAERLGVDGATDVVVNAVAGALVEAPPRRQAPAAPTTLREGR